MATLQRTDTQNPVTVTLSQGTQVGRSRRKSDLVIDDPSVSAVHAILAWDGGGWTVRDLSTNGTFVDGQRLPSGAQAPLRATTTLRFGDGPVWRVTDLSPPQPCAMGPDGRIVGEHALLTLPESGPPAAVVNRGADGEWMMESSEGVALVVDGQWLTVSGRSYQLSLPPWDSTVQAAESPRCADVALTFLVSRDEENVALTIETPTETRQIPPRAHHYLLVTLARLRLRDMEDGVPEHEQGWVEGQELSRMLAVDDNLLYTHIFRARKTFAPFELADVSNAVERRGGTQVRLGFTKLSVEC